MSLAAPYSHVLLRTLPSAMESLTSEFDMGSGVSSPLVPPSKKICHVPIHLSKVTLEVLLASLAQCVFLLVDLISDHKRSSQSTISIGKLNTLLCLHTQPIYQVVFLESIGIPYLEGGLAFRCFQRLSFPNIATRQCSWQNNRNTIGLSTSVLSY